MTNVTHRENRCEDEGRDWSDAAAAKDYQRRPVNHGSQEVSGGGSLSEPSGGTNFTGTLILDFWLAELWENMFLLFKSLRF